MNNVFKLVKYKPEYKESFIQLNKAWLNKFFIIEPHDHEQFAKVEDLILKTGGEIFFCIDEKGTVAGTVAMQYYAENVFELTKLAVDENYQGLGLSKMLMDACISFAKEKKASKIILFSSKKLAPAIALYLKYKFVEVPLLPTDYARADIQMEFPLT